MTKHRRVNATWAVTLMLLSILTRVVVCKPTDVPPTESSVSMSSDYSAVSTNVESSIESATTVENITSQTDKTNIESVQSRNSTTTNPILKLAHDLTKLYDSVSSFVSPWFSPAVDVKTETAYNDTESEFDDFDDPGEGEYPQQAQDPSDLLRYVRDVMGESNMVTSALDHVKHYFSNISSDSSHQEKLPSSLLRYVRDVMVKSDVVPRALDHAENYIASPAAPQFLQNPTLNKVARSLIRRVRDASEQGRKNIYEGYYDFTINEYSYKFWAWYMLAATAILLYSAIAAIYYAKFNTTAIDYETYDDIARSNGRSVSSNGTNPLGLVGSLVSVNTYQQIMDAISSRKYS